MKSVTKSENLSTPGGVDDLPKGPWPVILADPPWSWNARSPKGEGRSAKRHYNVMTLDDLCALPVEDVSATDSLLFLWCLNSMIPQAMQVMSAWGFTYKTVAFAWIKMRQDLRAPSTGMGFWTRQSMEMVLLGTRGHPKRISASVQQTILAARMAHSRKPTIVHDRIEELVDGPYLELFARRHHEGWTCWGNELEEKK